MQNITIYILLWHIYTFISLQIISQGSVNCVWVRISKNDKVNTKEVHFPRLVRSRSDKTSARCRNTSAHRISTQTIELSWLSINLVQTEYRELQSLKVAELAALTTANLHVPRGETSFRERRKKLERNTAIRFDPLEYKLLQPLENRSVSYRRPA